LHYGSPKWEQRTYRFKGPHFRLADLDCAFAKPLALIAGINGELLSSPLGRIFQNKKKDGENKLVLSFG